MSDSSQGPGWWQASDGKWYPPESRPQPPIDKTTPTFTTQQPTITPQGSGGQSHQRPWFKKKRFIIPLAFLALIIASSAAGNGKKSTTNNAQPTSATETTAKPAAAKATTTAMPTTTTTATPPPAPIQLSGRGQTATNSFAIAGGLTVFTASHSGSSNFALELLDANGKTVDVLVNEIGSYSGSTASGLSAGNYVLKISADGTWKVAITQPRSEQGIPVPHTFNGKGQQFVGPFSTKGAVRIQATHDGQSNFAIEVLNAEGETRDVAVNEIGSYSGSTAVSDLDGRYYLKIAADGNWTAAVSPI